MANNTKKILLIASCLALLYSIIVIQDTYAKYKTEASGDTNITIARWKLLVNNQDLKENKNFSNTITPVFEGDSNTKSGIIAPNAEGYFDITIDGTNTDVSYSYTMNIAISNDSVVKDLVITHYLVDNSSLRTFTDSNYSLSETVPYNQVNKIKTYRFYIKWNDDSATETMDNAADTTATTSGNAKFKVDITFIQIANNS